VAYSHFIYGVPYFRNQPVPVIVDQQNVDRVYWQNKADHSSFPFRLYAGWNAHRTIAYEMRVLRSIWAYVSVSDEDREQTRAYAEGTVRHFWVAPNGVDTDRFSPGSPPDDGRIVNLGYLGSMDLQMNVEAVTRFVRDLLPRIRAALRGREVRLVVIGRDPAPALRALATADAGIVLSGTVDDVRPWLRQVHMLVAPLRIGAGTKLKVAEAMSCALPVIGTSLAFAGLPGRAGDHYILADDDDAFVAAVCALSTSSEDRLAMGRRAREFTRQHLEWNAIGDRLAAEIREGLDGRTPAR
jgi:glycosyltransferase involved in cell wall biosynthesis